MYDIHVFGSGSSGNCIFVNSGDSKFLLDAGLSFKEIKKNLRRIGARFSDIDFILFTHYHIDHYKGIKNIVEKYNTKVVTTNGEALMLDIPSAMIEPIEYEQTIRLFDTFITGHKLPHDTNQPVYFTVKNSVGETLLYLTDCGTDVGIELEDYDIFIIEANYYMDGILNSVQNQKIHVVQFNRTTSGTGHLELNQTINLLKNSVSENTKHIILSHLSSTNGSGELFKAKVKEKLVFENVHIAENGLHVNYGENQNIF